MIASRILATFARAISRLALYRLCHRFAQGREFEFHGLPISPAGHALAFHAVNRATAPDCPHGFLSVCASANARSLSLDHRTLL
jgi:hypothetical protein